MSVRAPAPAPDWAGAIARLRRTAKSPKGMLIGIFAVILALAIPGQDGGQVATHLLVAVAAAVATDLVAARLQGRGWILPDGALLTGLIVGMVLSPFEHIEVTTAAAAIAIASKHLIRVGPANVLNPAAFGIVAVSILFDSIQDWWGALPDLGLLGAVAIATTGVFIADRVNKLPLVLSLLAVYFALFTGAAFVPGARDVTSIFREPDLQMVLFFALFMADDPPTVPIRYRDQLIFGSLVAVGAFALFEAFGLLYFLPAALLAGNVYEGIRKWTAARERRQRAERHLTVGATPAREPAQPPQVPEPVAAARLWSRPE